MDTFDKLRQIYENRLKSNPSIIERDYYYSYSCGFSYDSLDKELDASSCKLILMIMVQLKRTNEFYTSEDQQKIVKRLTVILNPELCNLSRNTLYKSIKSLVDQDVILKNGNTKGEYIVNPYYFNILSKKQYKIFVESLFKKRF